VSSLSERYTFLLAMALLAGLGAAAYVHQHAHKTSAVVASAAAPGGGWFDALAASRGPAGDAERTSCGLILTSASLGITQPVLPCGAKIVMRFGGRSYFTEVIDNRLKGTGHQFELTDALAAMLGLDGTQRIQWRFAAGR
jgi:hypothetical protein